MTLNYVTAVLAFALVANSWAAHVRTKQLRNLADRIDDLRRDVAEVTVSLAGVAADVASLRRGGVR